MDALASRFSALTEANEAKLEAMRATVAERFEALQADNGRKLEEARQIGYGHFAFGAGLVVGDGATPARLWTILVGLIDAVQGETSQFHQTHGFNVHDFLVKSLRCFHVGFVEAPFNSPFRAQHMQREDSTFDECHFLPWIGDRYDDGGLDGLRVLVLGESHYDWGLDPSKERQATRFVMASEISGSTYHEFFSRVGHTLFGRAMPQTRAELSVLWNRVAFYNYVQEYVGNGPQQRPSKEAWIRAESPLRVVLNALQPDFVLSCGRELYDHLKGIPGLTQAPEFGRDQSTRSREIACGERWAVIGLINHPASHGFSPAAWRPRVLEYLARAGQVKSMTS